jgi:Integrase zinc binding domain
MLSRAHFLEFQRRDPFCHAVAQRLRRGELPEDTDLSLHLMVAGDQYNLEPDGLLVHLSTSHPKRGHWHVLLQWVVPTALRTLVLKLCHDDATASHAGVGATQLRIFERYYWQGMSADVRTYVPSCLACQLNKL